MNSPEKQLKYSIRKVSVGAASVVIGALYLLMGAGIAHAEGVESAREAERTANPTDPGQSGIGEPENKTDLSHTDAAANTYNAPVADNPLVTPESTKPRTRSKRELADEEASDSSNGATGTESGPTSGNEGGSDTADTDSDLLDANRKGDTVKEHQPGVIVPKDGEKGGDDKNANLTFDAPKENLTLEQLWDIVKNMPDDFQNNERSYLRNMNTLGDALGLEPGEIRELKEFGGWSAIDKEGNPGKFVIGKKNEQGYFTGWYVNEKGEKIQGGMLGADALDNIYVHEQALDRRFKYMLMLVKGRTRANRNEKVSDNSDYDPRAQNERAGKNSTEFKNLPFLEKDEYNKYSPGVVGYNGIEKQFTAFSPDFGSRVRVEFVTGYISDINGSKGSYRVVVNAKKEDGTITKVYDQAIHRIAEIVQNEDLYKKGLNVELANKVIKNFFDTELKYRRNRIFNTKKNSTSLRGKKRRDYTEEDKKLEDELRAQALEEAKKQGDIVLNVDQNTMHIKNSAKRDSEWKKTFTHSSQSTTKLSNELNNLLKVADKDTPNTPTWLDSSTPPAKADDRAYRLLTTLIPGAKKITYHVNDDQLEVETENYTYTAARNGSKEVGIQGSDIAATLSADEYNANRQTFESANTNTKANDHNHGWARAGSEEFKNFSHFIGVDKGIVRTKVLTDKELSDKIRAAVGPGDSNLGKGGYFSTGDVLLGKDVVSYTVQVFSENNERVGVNPQSHRVQYNLPILADFSVIQDTVEPSRTVVEKIIPKLNIPEEEKKKITEEIKKKKKTSELADLISGNVKVRYVDEQGNLLSLKNDIGIGEKESDGTYITNKKQLIGTSYDVTDKKLSSMTTTDGKYYTFEKEDIASASLTGDIVREGRTVTLVYRESEAPTTATVTANYYKEGTQEKLAESVVKADLAIGSQYTTEAKTIEGKTTTEDKEDRVITRKTTYTLVAIPANATGTVPEDGATVNYYYRENVEETVVPKTATSTETKTITRTIHYVDKVTNQNVKEDVVQPVTLSRTKIENKVTGVVTYGEWTTGNWDEKASPSVENYGPAETATVSSATVTSASTDETVVVKYPQATEDIKESKTVTRTIKYVDATDETTEVASPVTQTVTLTRTNKRNKVTGKVTAGDWSTGTWGSQDSPTVTNYDAPDKATVAEATVT
ncbi:adhesin, partial [Streptococcus pseudopneumoniae 5247]